MPAERPSSRPRDGREFVRVAVTLPRHPKLLDTPDPARCGWLFVVSVMYARENLTDGVVRPDAVVHEARVPKRLARELVRVGLWHDPGHDCARCAQPPAGCVVVHDYGEHNQTRDEVEQLRAAGRAAAEARWKGRGSGAKPNAGRNADRIPKPNAEAEAEVESPLLTYVGRLAGGDNARTRGAVPAEVIAAWQEHAGPDVDLVAEARAYLVRHGTRPATNEAAAWAGWLTTARNRAASTAAAVRRREACLDPDCAGGWLPPGDDDRPRPCPTCRPHLRPAEESA